jgi:hypothetical protein
MRKEDDKINLEEAEREVLELVNLINYRDQWRVIVDMVMNLSFSLPVTLKPCGPLPLFQFLNPIRSR